MGTRGAVVGEASLQSATVAGVAGTRKVRRIHKAGCPHDAQVPVESHPGARDRAGVPVLRVRMGMQGERAPGRARVVCHRVREADKLRLSSDPWRMNRLMDRK